MHELAMDNYLFYDEVHKFKNGAASADLIMKRFVEHNSVYEISVEYTQREKLIQLIQSGLYNTEVFDEILIEVRNFMLGTYGRLKKTNEFKIFLKAHLARNISTT